MSSNRFKMKPDAPLSVPNHRQERLLAAMGNPQEWEYTGEILESEGNAQCACGERIRWIFPIHRKRDGATLPIGSTCILKSIPALQEAGADELAGKLHAATQRLLTRLNEARKRQKGRGAESLYRAAVLEGRNLAQWFIEVFQAAHARSVAERCSMPGMPGYFRSGEWDCLLADDVDRADYTEAYSEMRKRIYRFRRNAERMRQWWENENWSDCWKDPPARETDGTGDGDTNATTEAAPAA